MNESTISKLKTPPQPDHEFDVNLEADCFTEEKYQLFRNYQHNVHGEALSTISSSGFRRFLCNSPLARSQLEVSNLKKDLGSFHQCYRLNGKLIAMAVLDLLPNGVSAVYFIYHSDFHKYSFGKISALQEIALALESGRQYYYMGYYIQSCIKMRYKADYKPQYILDPESYVWRPLDEDMKKTLELLPGVSVSLSRENRMDENCQTLPTVDKDARTIFGHPREAAKAVKQGLSLFKVSMPGVMTKNDIEAQLDLSSTYLQIGNKQPFRASVSDFSKISQP